MKNKTLLLSSLFAALTSSEAFAQSPVQLVDNKHLDTKGGQFIAGAIVRKDMIGIGLNQTEPLENDGKWYDSLSLSVQFARPDVVRLRGEVAMGTKNFFLSAGGQLGSIAEAGDNPRLGMTKGFNKGSYSYFGGPAVRLASGRSSVILRANAQVHFMNYDEKLSRRYNQNNYLFGAEGNLGVGRFARFEFNADTNGDNRAHLAVGKVVEVVGGYDRRFGSSIGLRITTP